MTFITRFAPSPTGELHLGHAYSALLAWDLAQAAGGIMHLRIEDIDRPRCRPEFEAAIFADLAWLGLSWPEPVWRQSTRQPEYEAALAQLAALGLTYPCSCTRGDIRAALSAPQEGAQTFAPDGPVYPGTCRARPMASRKDGDAVRLDMAKAITYLGQRMLTFCEEGPLDPGQHPVTPQHLLHEIGDVVLARRDIATSYHLAVVVDDAAQNISHIIRGADLFEATRLHVVLQLLLDLPVPTYHHHRLVRDTSGTRLAKRDHARALAKLREDGASPLDIRALIGL